MTKEVTTAKAIAHLLEPVVPHGTAVDVRPIEDYVDHLFPAEMAAIARAVPARRREFSAGRASARAAMAALSLPPQAIAVGANREPLWPNGYIGSITHADGLCISVVRKRNHVRSIGIDVTASAPLDLALRTLVCAPEELPPRLTPAHVAAIDVYKVLFSAKEALFKALFPLVQRFVDFREVRIDLDRPGSWKPSSPEPDLAPVCSNIEGRLVLTSSAIVALCWCSAAEDDPLVQVRISP